MEQPNDFRFTLKTETAELELKFAPEGWKEYGSQWVFDEKKFGYSRKVTIPMRFLKDGADFLRRIYSNDGINGDCQFIVERLDRPTYQYFTDFIGNIDFSKLKDDLNFFEVSIIEKGVKDKLKAYEKSKYEIDIDRLGVDIQVPEGMNFYEHAKYSMPDVPETEAYVYKPDEQPNIQIYEKATAYVTATKGIEKPMPPSKMQLDDGAVKSFEMQFFPIDDEGTVIPGEDPLVFLYKKATGVEIDVSVNIDLSTYIAYIRHFSTQPPPGPSTVDVFFSIWIETETNLYQAARTNTITLQNLWVVKNPFEYISEKLSFQLPKEKCSVIFYCVPKINYGNAGIKAKIGIIGDISYNYLGVFQTLPFTFKAMPVLNFANELAKKTCKTEENIIDSHFLKTMSKNLLYVASSDSIRGIPEAKGQSSFDEFWQSIDALYMLGQQVENEKISIEKRDWIFNPLTELLDVGEVSELSFEIPEDWIFNKFNVGYENQNYDEQNGRDEFNIGLQFESPLTSITGEGNIISKYRADSFGIQNIRYEYSGNDTKDSTSDNDMFFIYCKKVEDILQVDNTSQLNIKRKGAFNAQITPKRNMQNWFPYLASIYDKVRGDLKYISSDKIDTDLTSSIYGDVVREKDDVPILSLGQKLFTPLKAKFKTGLRKNITQLIGPAPKGYIKFSYNGVGMKGFPIEIPKDSIEKDGQEWVLMMHPDTPPDITELVFG